MANMDPGGGDPPKIVASEICILVDGVEVSLDDYVEGLVSGSDPDVKAALVACLAELIVSPDANVLKAALNACIAAGLVPAAESAAGGIIWQAIKKCISGPPVVIPANTDAAAAAAAAGQNPGTLIINVGDGTVANPDYVWYVNADGTVTNIESPAFSPDPLVEAVAPAAATEDDHQAQADSLASGKAAGTNIKITDEWGCVWGYQVDESEVACRVDTPQHHNSCIDVRLPGITDVVFTGPLNVTQSNFDVTLVLANVGCYEAIIDIDVTGHGLGVRTNPGQQSAMYSGDIVLFNGAGLSSASVNDAAWQFENTTSIPNLFNATSGGTERHATLDPGAVGTLRWYDRTASLGDHVSAFRVTVEGGSANMELNS